MTKIAAQVVADSICNGHRITTMRVTMPRIILAEAKTHRIMSKLDEGFEVYEIPGAGFNDDENLSRNSASSRAIPLKKMIESVKNDPFVPIAWQKDHTGMQGTEYLDELGSQFCREIWLSARDMAVLRAEALAEQKATKQLCNRLLEPFMWHTVLVTATSWENFFHLRCPQYTDMGRSFRSWKDLIQYNRDHTPAVKESLAMLSSMTLLERLSVNKGQAEIHMMALAEAMWDEFNSSKPKELLPGQWHLPHADKIDEDKLYDYIKSTYTAGEYSHGEKHDITKVQICTAFAAQTSYTVVGEDGKPASYENLIDLHNSLLVRPYTNRKGVVFGADDPKHTSPAEHCAMSMTEKEIFNASDKKLIGRKGSASSYEAGWCHNFRGWKSYRSMIPNENRR